jgi:hypothetical protein
MADDVMASAFDAFTPVNFGNFQLNHFPECDNPTRRSGLASLEL